jgi:AAA domain/Transcriptional regulator, AbiEi antitoxin
MTAAHVYESDDTGFCYVCQQQPDYCTGVQAPHLNGTPVLAAVPNETASDQALGHSGHLGHTPVKGGVSQDLLAQVRTGTWLDSQAFPPLRYAVTGVIPEGFTVLAGAPKAGKSWLLLAVQLAIASGGRALSAIPTGAPRRVLYLALEDGDRRMQDRCRQLLTGEPIPPLFCYLTRIEPGTVVATIEAFCERHPDTALVVIDTLGKVMPPPMPTETTYGRDYRVGGRLKAIADARPGLAVVASHHDRKAGSEDFVERVSGTNGLAGAADTVIVLARKRQSPDGLLMVTGRDIPEGEYAITMSDAGTWALDGDTLAQAAAAARHRAEASEGLSDLTVQILGFIRDAGQVTAGQVTAAYGENSRRYLTRLVDTGRLERVGRGVYSLPPVPSVPLSQSQVSASELWDSDAQSVPNDGEE